MIKKLLLENKKRIFEPTQKSETGIYLCKVKKYGLFAIKEREIKCKKKLEKRSYYNGRYRKLTLGDQFFLLSYLYIYY